MKTEMKTMLLAAVLLSSAFPAASAEEPEEADRVQWREYVSVNAFAEIQSSYVARGKVVDAHPFSAQFIGGVFRLGDFGRIGGYAWSVSSLTGDGQSAVKRYAYNEVDYNLRYSYGFEVAEGWTLDSFAARQWVTLPGYPGANTICEWQTGQSMVNPFVTPYWFLRHASRPAQWNYWCVGLRRSFEIAEDLTFSVNFYGDLGDSRHFLSQYGAKPDAPGSSYRDGLQALNLVLRLNYKLTENLVLYAFVWQFDVVSADARAALKASSAAEAKRDVTVGGAGVALNF